MRLHLTGNALEFACRSAACRPPTSGGTGGSKPSSHPYAVARAALGAARGENTVESPHYKTRTAEEAGAMSEGEALALVRDKDATGRRVLDKGVTVAANQAVGVRANLNVKKSTGITVQTIHAGTDEQLAKGTGMFSGEAIGYGAAVTLHSVNFSVNQQARYRIASKAANKYPMASVDGKFVPDGGPSKFHGIEVKFNPMKQHVFVDPDGRAVKSADRATVVGSKVFVSGRIKYYTDADMPKPIGDIPTDAHT